ncbi:hypothetical protein DFH11DRAFT_1539975 [Phellopilus nigrolimitatus]|nr:hypothetical protein DFH11DRAFT_1539975 [Phellopilus nigrolimitatus]
MSFPFKQTDFVATSGKELWRGVQQCASTYSLNLSLSLLGFARFTADERSAVITKSQSRTGIRGSLRQARNGPFAGGPRKFMILPTPIKSESYSDGVPIRQAARKVKSAKHVEAQKQYILKRREYREEQAVALLAIVFIANSRIRGGGMVRRGHGRGGQKAARSGGFLTIGSPGARAWERLPQLLAVRKGRSMENMHDIEPGEWTIASWELHTIIRVTGNPRHPATKPVLDWGDWDERDERIGRACTRPSSREQRSNLSLNHDEMLTATTSSAAVRMVRVWRMVSTEPMRVIGGLEGVGLAVHVPQNAGERYEALVYHPGAVIKDSKGEGHLSLMATGAWVPMSLVRHGNDDDMSRELL